MKTDTQPNLTIRRADERFHGTLPWLESRHTFSFGEHYDPAHMGYRALRVINDDVIAPNQGFGMHPHRQMEIFTYVISGELAHKDSMGNGRTIKAGEFQYMSAGTGVSHSEVNPSSTEPVHLLQIWLMPNESGEPRYRDFDTKPLRQHDGLTLLASPDGRDETMEIRQDAEISIGHLSAGKSLAIDSDDELPYRWLHVISGEVSIAGETLKPGDAASFDGAASVDASAESEFLLFTLS